MEAEEGFSTQYIDELVINVFQEVEQLRDNLLDYSKGI
jgi:hypothetical protein